MRLESSSLPASYRDAATIALAFSHDRYLADRHAHSLHATDFVRVAVTETVPRDPAFHTFHHPITAIARRPGRACARSSRTEVPRRGKTP
jgi:hypothetical protein